MLYWRSMTLAERAEYTAKVQEWFPQVEIVFLFDTEFFGVEPGTPNTHDNTVWRLYRNGVLLENYIYTYAQVNYEGGDGFGVVHLTPPDSYREQIRDQVVGDVRVFVPFVTEAVPSNLVVDASAALASGSGGSQV